MGLQILDLRSHQADAGLEAGDFFPQKPHFFGVDIQLQLELLQILDCPFQSFQFLDRFFQSFHIEFQVCLSSARAVLLTGAAMMAAPSTTEATSFLVIMGDSSWGCSGIIN